MSKAIADPLYVKMHMIDGRLLPCLIEPPYWNKPVSRCGCRQAVVVATYDLRRPDHDQAAVAVAS